MKLHELTVEANLEALEVTLIEHHVDPLSIIHLRYAPAQTIGVPAPATYHVIYWSEE